MAVITAIEINGESLSKELERGLFAVQKKYDRDFRQKVVGCDKPFGQKSLTPQQVVVVCSFYGRYDLIEKYGLSSVQIVEIGQTDNVQMSSVENRHLDNVTLDNSDIGQNGNVKMSNLDNQTFRRLDNPTFRQSDKVGQNGNVEMSNLDNPTNGHSTNGYSTNGHSLNDKALKVATKQLAALEVEKTVLLSKLNDLESQNANLSSLSSLSKTTVADLDKLKSELSKLRAELLAANNLSKTAAEKLDKSELDKSELSKKLMSKIGQLESELSNLRTQMSGTQLAVGDQLAEQRKKLLEESDVERKKLTNELAELRGQVKDAYDNAKGNFVDERKRLNDQIDAHLAKIAELEADKKAIEQETKQGFESERIRLNSEISSLTDRIKVIQSNIEQQIADAVNTVKTAHNEELGVMKKLVKEANTYAELWQGVEEYYNTKPFLKRLSTAVTIVVGIDLFQAYNTYRFVHLTEYGNENDWLIIAVSVLFSCCFQGFGLLQTFNNGKKEVPVKFKNAEGKWQDRLDINGKVMFKEEYNMLPVFIVSVIFAIINVLLIFWEKNYIGTETAVAATKMAHGYTQKFALVLVSLIGPVASYFSNEIVLNIMLEDEKIKQG